MAWLLNRSPTWRRFVEATKNPWTFVGVTIATCGVAYLAGDFAVKFVDSPTEQQVVDERFKELPVEQQVRVVLASARRQ